MTVQYLLSKIQELSPETEICWEDAAIGYYGDEVKSINLVAIDENDIKTEM